MTLAQFLFNHIQSKRSTTVAMQFKDSFAYLGSPALQNRWALEFIIEDLKEALSDNLVFCSFCRTDIHNYIERIETYLELS